MEKEKHQDHPHYDLDPRIIYLIIINIISIISIIIMVLDYIEGTIFASTVLGKPVNSSMGGTSAGLHEPQDQFHPPQPEPEHGQWKQPDGKLCRCTCTGPWICESHLRTMAFCPGLCATTARSAHGSIESESNQFLLAEQFIFSCSKSPKILQGHSDGKFWKHAICPSTKSRLPVWILGWCSADTERIGLELMQDTSRMEFYRSCKLYISGGCLIFGMSWLCRGNTKHSNCVFSQSFSKVYLEVTFWSLVGGP